MKNLLSITLTAAAFAAAVPVFAAPRLCESIKYYEAPATPLTRAEGEVHTVVLDVDYDLPLTQELSGLYAVESTGADTNLYYGLSEEEDSHIYEFHLPDGTYDFYVGAILGDYEGSMVLTLNNMVIDRDMDLNLQASSAIYRTDISHIAPDGSELRMAYDRPAGNVPSAQFIQALMHNGNLILLNALSTDSPGMNYILSNNTSSNYTVTRLDIMHSPFGFLTMVIPVDFTKEECGTDTEGWQMATEEFSQTPANLTMQDYYALCGQPDYYYGFCPAVMMINGRTNGTAGLGMFDPRCPTGTVGTWAPADYSGPYELWPVPTGASITGWSSDTSALPLRRSEDGLQQVGLNLLPGPLTYFASAESPLAGPEYQAYSGEIPQGKLGNCTPILILYPEEEYFEFTFKGRYGESLSQASNYYTIPSVQYWLDIFGEPLCELKFYRDGVLVCDDRNDFPYDTSWGSPTDYILEIGTSNVLIDSETPGFVQATHTFGRASENLMPPTLTSLRIEDAQGEITDRLQDSEGAKAIFTGGHFFYVDNYEERYVYADWESVNCTSAEYSPRGEDSFEPLNVKEIGEPILPGYGNQFEVDLSGVTAESADGWYDLRITIEDESGSTQTQLISPAFRIGTGAGIQDINISEKRIDLNSPEVEIYTVAGQRVDRASMVKGIYIVKHNGTSTKVIL